MKLTLACAYCFGAITTKLGDTELKTDRGKLDRDGKVCTIQCPHCDSTFAVHVTTKRVRKGKRRSAAEAKEQAEFDHAYCGAVLAITGCSCGWQALANAIDTDDQFAHHVAVARVMEGGSTDG